MARILMLYLATLTRSGGGDPGTDSTVNLVITQEGMDLLNERLTQDRRVSQGNLDTLDVSTRGIDSSRLTDGSVRIGLLGNDQWNPEIVFVWGTSPPSPGTVGNDVVVPLAIETELTVALSTDDPGAVPSVPVRTVALGSPETEINELLLITRTGRQDPDRHWWEFWDTSGTIGSPAGQGQSATDDRISLQVTTDQGLAVQHLVPDTSQEDLEGSEVNIYPVPVIMPFTRESIRGGVILGIDGTDAWLPTAVFVFGVHKEGRRPTSIVPLVQLDPWNRGSLSTDRSEGEPSVDMPLVGIPVTGLGDLITEREPGAGTFHE